MGRTVTAPPASRVTAIDRMRGLAVLLMVLDHALVLAAPDSFVRFTATRLSLPLFCFAAAVVWRPDRSRRRMLQLGAVALVVEPVLNDLIGLGVPGPVFLLLVVTLAGGRLARHPLLFATLGLVQALYLPIGLVWPEWSGYQPGLVVAWWCIGRLGWDEVARWGAVMPRVFAPVGRRPMGWYVGHLLVLAAVAGQL